MAGLVEPQFLLLGAERHAQVVVEQPVEVALAAVQAGSQFLDRAPRQFRLRDLPDHRPEPVARLGGRVPGGVRGRSAQQRLQEGHKQAETLQPPAETAQAAVLAKLRELLCQRVAARIPPERRGRMPRQGLDLLRFRQREHATERRNVHGDQRERGRPDAAREKVAPGFRRQHHDLLRRYFGGLVVVHPIAKAGSQPEDEPTVVLRQPLLGDGHRDFLQAEVLIERHERRPL
jgi:hypothetical protein